MYFSLTGVPVYPECGSRQFMLRVLMKYVSGNPVKIDGTRPGESYTNALAINSFYGTALPVPNLISDAEMAAESAIRSAGYVVGTISSTLSASPAGTVISQNPSAGIIELPGSPVDFTVSTGGVIVPKVISLPQSDATSAISARGLVPSVSSSKKCINPGDVLTQNPSAGVLVAPGSTVHITVDSGTPRTCRDIQ
jgi:serine/threonine-protein kinase